MTNRGNSLAVDIDNECEGEFELSFRMEVWVPMFEMIPILTHLVFQSGGQCEVTKFNHLWIWGLGFQSRRDGGFSDDRFSVLLYIRGDLKTRRQPPLEHCGC